MAPTPKVAFSRLSIDGPLAPKARMTRGLNTAVAMPEVWLALDLAVRLENDGYSVSLGEFCERRLTPRNLLISARLN